MKRILGCLLVSAVATATLAQGGTNSPYSQFGLGELTLRGGGFNKGMNGLGIGLQNGTVVNPLNPASYAAIDSLTFLFDMGLSGQMTNYNENGTKVNARSGNFDYAMGAFRLVKNVGVAFGVMPVSNVGYDYKSTTRLTDATDASTTVTTRNAGSGGLQQLFIGIGARIFKQLSIGVNGAYLWGNNKRSIVSTGSSINTLSRHYDARIRNFTIDAGLQYVQPVGKDDRLTVGLTYGLGHNLKDDALCSVVNTNSTINKADTTSYVIKDAFELPHTFGAGVSFAHGNQWVVGADVQIQKWGSVSFPSYANSSYTLRSGQLKDTYRYTLGGDLQPRWNSRRFFDRLHYRFGVGYATSYYKVNGVDGPKELSATIGLGIPIQNTWNNRSLVNISAQYVHRAADGLITENSFRINLGITFNERWFAKWRFE